MVRSFKSGWHTTIRSSKKGRWQEAKEKQLLYEAMDIKCQILDISKKNAVESSSMGLLLQKVSPSMPYTQKNYLTLL